jgi:type I restriction enzyme R subunit
VDKAKAKAYFEALEGQEIPMFKANIKTTILLQGFIFQDGFALELPAG